MADKTKEEVNAGADIEPIVVLDLIMPNGKRMRDCTVAEMKRFGDFLLKRAEQFKKACLLRRSYAAGRGPRTRMRAGDTFSPAEVIGSRGLH